MAFFKKTTKNTAVSNVGEKATQTTEKLVRPLITEKAANLAEKGTYVFEVSPAVNKFDIAKIVAVRHKVTPIRVNIINLPKKQVMVRGKAGIKSGTRKALVTLKKGEKIELI